MDIKLRRQKAREYYWKNREHLLEYKVKYDNEHRKEKRLYDQKRRKDKNYKAMKRTHSYSQIYHLPILMKKYGKCQICGSTKGLLIHHKKYDTHKIEDCLLVCRECHKKIHKKQFK